MKKIVIAIDGYSACGKSSTAKQVAKGLSYHFIDSGAMYRAATLFFLKENTDLKNLQEVSEALARCTLTFRGESILLNGKPVDEEIRSVEVNQHVSEVSAISEVRRKMVSQQRAIGANKEVVMDGRDIGTVVFPEAELKIFMIAEINIRAKRRQKELVAKEIDEPLSKIIENLESRDLVDSNRTDSPLRKAEDAIEIDTTHLALDQQIQQIIEMAKKIIHES